MDSTKYIKVAMPFVGEEEVEAVREVLLSGRYVSGPKVKEFEEAFADYLGVEHCVAVNSGTAALHVALAVLGIGPGDEVIVPPMTFFSTVTSVLHQNAIPIFADIDADSYCLDPKSVEEKITPETKAVIPVHLWGNSADMDGLLKVAREHDIKVIEDCAQSHGTEYKSRKTGSIGDFGCFSFFATKHMTTGEGGAITTDNKAWADLARKIRSHGMVDRDHHNHLGYNYRMNEIAAAIGVVQLRKLDELNQKRIDNSLYLLKKLEEEKIPWIKTPKLEKHIRHTFFWCPVIVDEEGLGYGTGELREKLKQKGVETRHRYWEPLYKQKILVEKNPYPRGFPFNSKHYTKDIDYGSLYLENAENISGRAIGLPNHPGLNRDNLDYVVDVLMELNG